MTTLACLLVFGPSLFLAGIAAYRADREALRQAYRPRLDEQGRPEGWISIHRW